MQVCQAESKRNYYKSLSQRERYCLFVPGNMLLRSKIAGEVDRGVSPHRKLALGLKKRPLFSLCKWEKLVTAGFHWSIGTFRS